MAQRYSNRPIKRLKLPSRSSIDGSSAPTVAFLAHLVVTLASLKRVREIFGGAIQALPPEEALDTLRKVNRGLRDQSHCPKDSVGNPGGVLKLPYHLTPILVGDLHAQLDNLLKILSENTCLESLENGQAALILLGDAVQSEQDGKLEERRHWSCFIGHHPYSEEGTLWLNAGRIDQHHIIVSARPDRIGLMTRIDGDLIPEIYPTEPLRAWLNEQTPTS